MVDSPARPEKPASPAVVDLTALPPTPCPCGIARRAFADRDEFPGTVHLTEITRDAQTHYHRHHTEVYVVLGCEPDAAIELDGVANPVRPKTAILIPPGVRHRGLGKMTVMIVCTPNFDPADEYFD
jgi:mannose-6-phosphate isomerase-like protein (cupin superfamily)